MYVNIVNTMRHGHESITPPSSDRNFGDLASELAAEQFIPSSSARAMVSYVIAKACRERYPHVTYEGSDKHPDKMFRVAQIPVTRHKTYDAKTGQNYAFCMEHDTADGWLSPPGDGEIHGEYEDEEGNRFLSAEYRGFNTDLYKLFNGRHVLQLSAGELDDIKDSRLALERTLGRRGMEYSLSLEQIRDAYHFSKNGTVHERGDFDALRVYVPGGARGAEIANRVLSDGYVDVVGGKVWLPEMRNQAQHFRNDTPIFLVNNFDSLAALVGKLRSLDDLDGTVSSVVGAPVRGAEGVFVGQDLGSGTSFSYPSNNMFKLALKEAIEENNLRTGEYLTQEWREDVARATARIAMVSAEKFGFSPYHHAFHEDPKTIDEILKIIS